MKKEEARAAQKEKEQWDELKQKWDDFEWEQAKIELWRQELEERELAVAAREKAVFQRELEYWHLERYPLCGRRGRGDDAQRRQARVEDGARRGEDQRRRQVITRQSTARIAAANAALEGHNDPNDRPRAGRLLQRALNQRAERTGGNTNAETWEQTCAALRMTPQRSPFQFDQAGTGVAIHGPLIKYQTSYPRFVITTSTRDPRRAQQTNGEQHPNEVAGADEGQGSCAGAQRGPTDEGQ